MFSNPAALALRLAWASTDVISINGDDPTGRPDEPSRDHCDIAHAASKVEHAHAIADPSLPKQPFRERLKQPSLTHEAKMLRFNGIQYERPRS